jgi:ketosteroid isomerase-like protein
MRHTSVQACVFAIASLLGARTATANHLPTTIHRNSDGDSNQWEGTMTKQIACVVVPGYALSVLVAVSLCLAYGTIVAGQGDLRTAIEAGNKAFAAAFAQGKAAEIAALYTADAQAFPPNSEVVSGRAAIQKLWQGAIDSGVKEVALSVTEVEGYGDTAHEVGTYLMKDANGKQLDRGKYIVVWKKQQGQWKMHRDIWNTSAPKAEAATGKELH